MGKVSAQLITAVPFNAKAENSNINQQYQCHVPSAMKLCLSLTWSVMITSNMIPLLLIQLFGSCNNQLMIAV